MLVNGTKTARYWFAPTSRASTYVTCEGRILRKGDKLKSCGVRDGSTVQVTSRMRGGGKHKDKKGKEEKKRSASSELNEESQEVRLDDGMYASMCEQMRLMTECAGKPHATSEEMQENEDGDGRCEKARDERGLAAHGPDRRRCEQRVPRNSRRDLMRKSKERPREEAKAKGMEEKENMHAEEKNTGEREQ